MKTALVILITLIATPVIADSTTYDMGNGVKIEEHDGGGTTTHYDMGHGVTIRHGENSGTDYDMGNGVVMSEDDE